MANRLVPTLQQAGKQPQSRVHFLAILATASALRLLMIFSVARGDPRFWFFNQASEYGCLAQSMLSGHGYASPFCGSTGPSAFLAPGYPLIVAAVFRLFGSYSVYAATALLVAQMLFALLTLYVLMRLTKRLLGSRAANVAGTLWAVSPPALGLPVLFWETSLSLLLLTSAIATAIYCTDHPKLRNWTAFGVFCALAMFVNPSLALTLAGILLWMSWRSRHLLAPAIALFTWLAVFSIWPIRNAHVLHAFVPLRSNMGYELWQGNRPGSDGTFAFALHPNANVIEYTRYAQLGELGYMQEKSALAIAAIKADKARFAELSLSRVSKFWLNSTSYRASPLLSMSIALTSLVSLLGLALLFVRRPAVAWLLAVPYIILPAPYYFTHADFRFRLLLDPLAMLLAAFIIEECMVHVKLRSERNASSAEVRSSRSLAQM